MMIAMCVSVHACVGCVTNYAMAIQAPHQELSQLFHSQVIKCDGYTASYTVVAIFNISESAYM